MVIYFKSKKYTKKSNMNILQQQTFSIDIEIKYFVNRMQQLWIIMIIMTMNEINFQILNPFANRIQHCWLKIFIFIINKNNNFSFQKQRKRKR